LHRSDVGIPEYAQHACNQLERGRLTRCQYCRAANAGAAAQAPPSGGHPWEGVRMTSASPQDPMAALNEFLSEVIDVVMALSQAHHQVPETHQLHAELNQLFSDAKTWAELLMEADTARGVSALDYMPSVAGRQRPNMWHGRVSDDDVRQVVTEQLHRLGQHLRAALSEQDDDRVRDVLDRISTELRSHLDALRKP
jgi:DNA-binding ferritin-like protein